MRCMLVGANICAAVTFGFGCSGASVPSEPGEDAASSLDRQADLATPGDASADLEQSQTADAPDEPIPVDAIDAPESSSADRASDERADADVLEDTADAVDVHDAGVDGPETGCTPGAYRCLDDALARCAADGSTWEHVATCAPGLCDVEHGACDVCRPGDKRCDDDKTAAVCDADGRSWLPLPCSESVAHCVGLGRCVACATDQDCAVSERSCWRAQCLAHTCAKTPKDPGSSCGDGGVCNGSGRCAECRPGVRRCDGLTAQICSDQGDWVGEETCPLVCLEGECTGDCVPDSLRCVDNAPERCGVAGAWERQAPCEGALPECFRGRCEPATPPSCVGLANLCGVDQADRCCRTTLVAGGEFRRSYDGVLFSDPAWTAAVSDFVLDVYEVTVGRFRTFVASGAGTQTAPPAASAGAHPAVAQSGWNPAWSSQLASDADALRATLRCSPEYATWTDLPGDNETRPITCVNWFEAFAFCAWDGGRLPTEAEWNYAAAGGSEQRVYAWSSPPSSTEVTYAHASFWTDAAQQCMGDGVPGCTVDDIVRVGSKPLGVGRWGHFELVGNAWEWTLDVFHNPYGIVPCSDCADLNGSDLRVVRGGSFFGNPSTLPVSSRGVGAQSSRFFSVGVRCARNVSP